MSEVLKLEMKKIINTKKDIFDDKTKNALIKKLDSMKVNTKYIQTLYDTKYLEKCYENVVYNDKDDVNKTYANLQKLNQILIDAEDNKNKDCLKLMRNDPPLFISDKEEHYIKYNQEENYIFFTPLFLLEPIFNEKLPFFYNFGTFGTILAHKFIELFNINENHLYGQDKNKMITDDSKKKFSKKAECFTKQYNSESVDKAIKDNRTLQNFIADSGGIKLAHKAYVTYINKYKIKVPRIRVFDKYTGEELFFITYGIINCEKYASKGGNNNMLFNSPHQVRVRGSLKNYKPFSEMFKCGTDKKMNPKNKCELW
uniref:Peptidase_M13 domain-containing protein n=1 Tax=Strongyloides papillosus TaxID=174720 RepID=A0A0N5CGI6_STREA